MHNCQSLYDTYLFIFVCMYVRIHSACKWNCYTHINKKNAKKCKTNAICISSALLTVCPRRMAFFDGRFSQCTYTFSSQLILL